MITNITNPINISKYVDSSFWTASGRSDFNGILWFVILSGIIVILGLIVFFFTKFFVKDSPPKKKLLVPFFWFLIGLGINGIILGLFRKEGVTFFSAYGLWALTIIGFVVVVSYFSFRYIRYLPQEQLKYESYKIKKKYLPKRKKRG